MTSYDKLVDADIWCDAMLSFESMNVIFESVLAETESLLPYFFFTVRTVSINFFLSFTNFYLFILIDLTPDSIALDLNKFEGSCWTIYECAIDKSLDSNMV
jgi:hypothetical protein